MIGLHEVACSEAPRLVMMRNLGPEFDFPGSNDSQFESPNELACPQHCVSTQCCRCGVRIISGPGHLESEQLGRQMTIDLEHRYLIIPVLPSACGV